MNTPGGTKRARRSGYQVLGIYLNDHLAGATAGTELAARIALTHQGQGDISRLRRFARLQVASEAKMCNECHWLMTGHAFFQSHRCD